MSHSFHASVRAQQRGIPPLIDQWLDEFGEEDFDGHGGIRRYFSNRSIRKMERAIGRSILRKVDEFLGCYKVISTDSGITITLGHRIGRLRRR